MNIISKVSSLFFYDSLTASKSSSPKKIEKVTTISSRFFKLLSQLKSADHHPIQELYIYHTFTNATQGGLATALFLPLQLYDIGHALFKASAQGDQEVKVDLTLRAISFSKLFYDVVICWFSMINDIMSISLLGRISYNTGFVIWIVEGVLETINYIRDSIFFRTLYDPLLDRIDRMHIPDLESAHEQDISTYINNILYLARQSAHKLTLEDQRKIEPYLIELSKIKKSIPSQSFKSLLGRVHKNLQHIQTHLIVVKFQNLQNNFFKLSKQDERIIDLQATSLYTSLGESVALEKISKIIDLRFNSNHLRFIHRVHKPIAELVEQSLPLLLSDLKSSSWFHSDKTTAIENGKELLSILKIQGQKKQLIHFLGFLALAIGALCTFTFVTSNPVLLGSLVLAGIIIYFTRLCFTGTFLDNPGWNWNDALPNFINTLSTLLNFTTSEQQLTIYDAGKNYSDAMLAEQLNKKS